MTRKLYIKTFGCQMNVYDSDRMTDVLAPAGYVTVGEAADADLVILNTCHIREKAAEKVYSDLGRLRLLKIQREKADKEMLIAVAGCVAQAEGAEIMRRAPDVDLVFGPQTYHRLPMMLKEARRQRTAGGRSRVVDTDFPTETKFDEMPEPAKRRGLTSFLTVQEGCDKFCTFCVVPYTRGAEYSRPMAEIITEAEVLVAGGVQEITLLGQNVNAYHGASGNGNVNGLAALIRRLAELNGLRRIRYTTSHPRDMNDDLIRVHAEVPQCMPYLHLPVQSGSDRILRAMNRGHDAADYLRIIEKLRTARPDIAVSGDFIVGFPGETDADFEATLGLVRDIGYAQAYSFKYSPRPGTPGAEMANQIPDELKSERLQRLQDKLGNQQHAFNRGTVGKFLPVLIEREGRRPGQVAGRSPYMQAVHIDFIHSNGGFIGDGSVDEVASADYTSQMPSMTSGQLWGEATVEILAAGPNSLEGRIHSNKAENRSE